MDLKETLMALEEQFWEASSAANVDLIRGYLTDDALTVGAFGVAIAPASVLELLSHLTGNSFPCNQYSKMLAVIA